MKELAAAIGLTFVIAVVAVPALAAFAGGAEIRVRSEEERPGFAFAQPQAAGDQTPVELGKSLASSQGCVSCHSTGTDVKVGPGWGGLFGKTETLQGGQTVQVDEAYLRESILQPTAKVVQGFDPVMPAYEGRLDDDQVNALIEYIKTLQ
jgi:cytochrome c oxidase subunit 2